MSLAILRPPIVPATRLAMFRIGLGAFVTGYFVARGAVYVELTARSADRFEPVGLVAVLERPLPGSFVIAVYALAIASGIGFTLGWRFALTGPLLAACALLLTTYRSSWGQLLHFENLFVLLTLIMAFAPAADAWALDSRRRTSTRDATAYGWVLELCCLVVVTTYFIAGVAKLRYGGLEWVVGDTLRNHIAYSAARLELLGAPSAPLAEFAIENSWVLPPMAAASVLIELSAPLTLVWRRTRPWWCLAAWSMHVGILATMLIGFPTPLFGVAFLPFFRSELVAERIRPVLASWRPTGARRQLR